MPTQIKSLKEELAKKASMLSKVKEEKASTGKVRFSPAISEAKEKEELRKTIRRLEERLRDGDVEDLTHLLLHLQAHSFKFNIICQIKLPFLSVY